MMILSIDWLKRHMMMNHYQTRNVMRSEPVKRIFLLEESVIWWIS